MRLPRSHLTSLVAAMFVMGCNVAVISGWSDDSFPIDDESDAATSVDDGSPTERTDDSSMEEIVFRPDVHRDLVNEGCASCHQRAGTPMRLVSEPGSDTQWRDTYEEVSARGTSLIDKATGAGGHGAFLDARSAIIDRWRRWIDAGAPFEAEEVPEGGPEPTDDDAGTRSVDAATPPPGGGEVVTYSGDVQPIIESNGCTRCHEAGESSEGSYDLSDYDGIMGPGSDAVPNVVPGDADSVLVDYARDGHQDIGYREALTIMVWVVDWDARRD